MRARATTTRGCPEKNEGPASRGPRLATFRYPARRTSHATAPADVHAVGGRTSSQTPCTDHSPDWVGVHALVLRAHTRGRVTREESCIRCTRLTVNCGNTAKPGDLVGRAHTGRPHPDLHRRGLRHDVRALASNAARTTWAPIIARMTQLPHVGGSERASRGSQVIGLGQCSHSPGSGRWVSPGGLGSGWWGHVPARPHARGHVTRPSAWAPYR
jgi:hypothetical protein